MSKTKTKIIKAAIALFNKNGMVNVRLQHIADSAGISLGNLTYHFNNKEAIMNAVYEKMTKDMEEMAFGSRVFIEGYEGFDIARGFIDFQKKYRFFYLDTLEIVRAFPEIKKSHQQQAKQEIKIIENLIFYSIGKGYLKAVPNEQIYKRLAHSTWILVNLWLTQEEIRGSTPSDEMGLYTIANLFYPYLTEKGLTKYNEEFSSTTIAG